MIRNVLINVKKIKIVPTNVYSIESAQRNVINVNRIKVARNVS